MPLKDEGYFVRDYLMPVKTLDIGTFLEQAREVPVADVRTPAEYHKGHIPGAANLPLFTNAERAVIGTLYKQEGREVAIRKGLELAGPKLTGFIRQAEKIAPQKRLLLHCWRGGMRSEALAWLLDFYGFETAVLCRGYKAFRRRVLSSFEQKLPLLILGGLTGSGKTAVLQELSALGEQVIDLEALACHCGSAFGSMGRDEQPSQEQFENNLFRQIQAIDPSRPVWMEDESANIGRIILPKPLRVQMRQAQLIRMDVPAEYRLNLLVEQYGKLDPGFLKEAIEKIRKRLGPVQTSEALAAVDGDRVDEAARIVLCYYDKTYHTGLKCRDPQQIRPVSLEDTDAARNAPVILEAGRQLMRKTNNEPNNQSDKANQLFARSRVRL